MKKSQLYFRVDGNEQIGLGHLIRSIALAQMLQNDYQAVFVCKEIPEAISNQLKDYGYILSIIENESGFLEVLNENDIVVLDHYGLDSDYQEIIKKKGCKLVCIDDLHDKLFFADLIINHSPGINSFDYKAQIYTQFALGLEYVLLRPVFLKAAKEDRMQKAIDTVFVCFGGSDSQNITQLTVDILKADTRFQKIIIVTGAAYSALPELQISVMGDERFSLQHAVDADTICSLIQQAGLAIVPASGILQEVLAVGCNVISGMYIANQENIFKKYKALNAFVSAEFFSKESILQAIDKVFDIPAVSDQKFIDGRSQERLLKYFKQFQIEEEASLRNAELNDVLKTFEWAVNSNIRQYSFNKNKIDFEDHENWFVNKIKDEACFYYLGFLDDQAFGSIRFDVDGDQANISYLVDPSYQNKGLGTILLKKGLELFIKQSGRKVSTICGEVFFENSASVKIFQKLGYTVELNHSTNILRFQKKLALDFN